MTDTETVLAIAGKNGQEWFRYDSGKDRRHHNKEFRLKEKQYFRRFGKFLKKCRSRGGEGRVTGHAATPRGSQWHTYVPRE